MLYRGMPDSIIETTLNDKTMFEEDKGMHKDKKVYDEVARVAYELFEKRGKIHGYSHADWLEAERIVLERHANEIDKEADSIRAAKKVKASEKTETTPAKAVKKTPEKAPETKTRKPSAKKTK
jgi:hypothetical protein